MIFCLVSLPCLLRYLTIFIINFMQAHSELALDHTVNLTIITLICNLWAVNERLSRRGMSVCHNSVANSQRSTHYNPLLVSSSASPSLSLQV
jgi:hypothetical protein